jgi:cyanophycin synthetase
MKAELTDSRRLTGANLYWMHPSAIIDVSIDGSPEAIIRAWEQSAERLLAAVGQPQEQTCHRIFDGGASLLISAAIDALYSMCSLNETAWDHALKLLETGLEPELAEDARRLAAEFSEEARPALLALQNAAQRHGVPFLWDDDEVSVGYGETAQVWAYDSLPEPSDVDWASVTSVPLALVTGTNGKSTTVRMTASIMKAAGYRGGLTSTDFIRVGERTIDTGDYSGTGGARMLMRQPDLDMAVLEVARGGLLRRGLGVERAQVAAVTNVAADHLGDYGILTVDQLIQAKLIVRKAVQDDGLLILNADDRGLVEFAQSLDQQLVWFSADPDNEVVRRHLEQGGSAAYLKDGSLVAARDVGNGLEERRLTAVDAIPATMGGVVRYNSCNALAAMCIALALGLPDQAIRQGLADFRSDTNDNPGRGNWFEHKGVRILVDFAHNPHGAAALAEAVGQIEARRVVLLIGQAGDRSDTDIRDYIHAACGMRPDRLLVCALPGYERGREIMEAPRMIREAAIESGIAESSIEFSPSPMEAAKWALGDARPGDLLVLLALTQRAETLELIHEFLEQDG